MAKRSEAEVPPAMVRGAMRRLRYEFVLEAAQPIAHHAEVIGNEALIMRRRVRVRGEWAEVPEITGDTMRHGMREASALALLEATGVAMLGLSEGALRLLFAGGMVTGRGDAGVIQLDQYRELCELIPTLGIFGGCCDNRVIPGTLTVEPATLICDETERFAPKWAVDFAKEHEGRGTLDTHRAHVEEVQRVRMDPTLIPERRKLLSDGAHVDVNKQLAASEAAHADDDAGERDRSKSTMMPRRFERVAQGSLFYWACEARCYSDLDVDTFHVSAAAFLKNACVGGKRGTGHGALRVLRGNNVPVIAQEQAFTDALATVTGAKVGELFRAHVVERKDRIAAFLQGVNA